jgi:16S rRNA (uracil1498-N3)-methyltransferase
MLVPVADRDRMLWCAEKCVELGASSWQPVMWHRSRSVSPRGEGASFAEKVRLRMESALVQSHAPWLPTVSRDAAPDTAIERANAEGTRLVLDSSGEPILRTTINAPVTIAVGPEGGFEPYELDALRTANFRTVSLGANVLRFETAAVTALAIVRSALAAIT